MATEKLREQLASEQEISIDLEPLRKAYEVAATDEEKSQARFNYAWGLIRSLDQAEKREGIRLMIESVDSYRNIREGLYYISVGYFQLKEYSECRRYCRVLLEHDSSNKQGQTLLKLCEEELTKDGVIGAAIAGGAVAAVAAGVGIMAFAIAKAAKR